MRSATTPRRVGLYARVSIERSKSVDDQLDELRAWADREGWEIQAVHRDDGVSASRYANGRNRPGWQQAMDDVTAGRVDALLVWEISRASRDRPVFAALFAACADADVRIGTGGRLHDLTDGDDGFALDLGAALAVREAAVTSKRVLRAVESRAAAGRPAGSVPYGYRRIIDPETGRTVGREKHPEHAPVVAEIVRRLLARESAGSIAKRLNERGIPTATGDRWLGRHLHSVVRRLPEDPVSTEIRARLAGGELPRTIAADLNAREVRKPVEGGWRAANLRILAVRPTYAGLRVHRGEVLNDVTATWPPIISAADHHRLVEMYSDPGRDKFRNPTYAKHLGTGIFRCGREGCGGRMRVVVQTPRPNRYDCRECHKISRLQAPVDDWVEAVLCARLARPDVLAELGQGDDPTTAEAAAEVARLKMKLRAARQAWDDDRMTLETYTDMEARTLPKIRAAEQRARPRHLPAALLHVVGPDAQIRWKALPIGERRAVLDAAAEVTILPAGRGSTAFNRDLVRITPRTG